MLAVLIHRSCYTKLLGGNYSEFLQHSRSIVKLARKKNKLSEGEAFVVDAQRTAVESFRLYFALLSAWTHHTYE